MNDCSSTDTQILSDAQVITIGIDNGRVQAVELRLSNTLRRSNLRACITADSCVKLFTRRPALTQYASPANILVQLLDSI